jgi:uncharacterized membrane protein YbhN (UPF0104 family)
MLRYPISFTFPTPGAVLSTDIQPEREVRAALERNPSVVNPTDISVSGDGASVTLRGVVPSSEQGDAAVQTAKSLPGVDEVVDQLEVQLRDDGGRGKPAPAHARHTRRVLGEARRRLQKSGLKLLGWLVFGYLLVKLVPSLKHALSSLQHVGWAWVLGAIALEVISEYGFVASWRQIVDPDNVLGSDGRPGRTAAHAAWAQLGGGMVIPGGSIASVGVGGWILHRFGMAPNTIAERQFTLNFLDLAVYALALVVFGVGLATGIFPGEGNLLLTLLPAVIVSAGIVALLLLARAVPQYGKRVESRHRKIAGAITSLADAVAATNQIVFHGDRRKSLLGALAYMVFDALVLWTAFFAIHAHPVPGFPAVMMAYIIGALGGFIPLPAGLGAVGGIAGMLALYGVGHNAAVASVLLYTAVGLLVPVIGGAIAYLFLRRQFGPARAFQQTA